jgi:uncharacterized protein (TIGR02118 family)
MTKVMFLLAKRPGMSRDEFQRHWRTTHAPLVTELPGILRQVLCHTQSDDTLDASGYDGIAEHWYADTDAVRVMLASKEFQTALADGEHFLAMDRVQMLVADEEEIPIPAR